MIDSSPEGGWGWVVVFSSFVCMILVEGVCLSYGLLVAPNCPGNTLRSLALTSPWPHSTNSGLATATSLGIIVLSAKTPRPVPIRPGSCLGVSEMGEDLHTQSRLALLAPGGLLVGVYLLVGKPSALVLSHLLT